MSTVEDFITGYDGSREGEIRFAWNGKHAQEFGDANYQFRKRVLDSIMPRLDVIGMSLLRDVFRAETQLSKEAWSIDRRVGQLAETLLKRGRAAYVEDYLLGRSQSFDAYLACATFQIDLDLARELFQTCQNHLRSEADAAKKKLWEFGEDVFGKWLRHLENEST